MKTIETTATVDAQQRLILNVDLSDLKNQQVRVIILVPENVKDISEHEWLQAAAHNDAFNFLKDEEVHYTASDGKPFNDQG